MKKKSKTKINPKGKVHVIPDKDMKTLTRKITEEIHHEVSSMAIYIFLAWLKDEERINNDPELLVETYKQLESWFKAIDDHLISVQDIKRIIEDATGMEVRLHDNEETRIEHEG